MNNRRISNIALHLLLIAFVFLFTDCNKRDISSQVEGVWETTWEDDLQGDLDKMYVNETIAFISENSMGNSGTFRQIFQGKVEYDDWRNETDIPYSVIATGQWQVVNKNEIQLKYDPNQVIIEVGKASIEEDYTDAAISLLTGDWEGVVRGAIKAKSVERLNSKAEENVQRQLKKFYGDMFHTINKDKVGMKSVDIEGNMMSCKVNHGMFGRKQTYDRVRADVNSISSAGNYSSGTSIDFGSDYGLPNYDWLSSRRATHSDVAHLNSSQLRIMRNYIYARHGYTFKSHDLANYFAQYPWYQPLYSNVEYDLNSIEKANVQFIKSYE